jgi:hypothetical protein
VNNFKVKYPIFSSLMVLVSGFTTGLLVQGESLVQKVEGEMVLLPQVLAFLPKAGGLKAELDALKAAGAPDIEAGAEVLVSDMAFSSAKAQGIIQAAFPVAESVAALEPQVLALVAAIKA